MPDRHGRIGIAVFLATVLAAAGFGVTRAQTAEPVLDSRLLKPRGSPDFDETVRRFVNRMEPKIIGGTMAPAGAYPWQVSLEVSWIPDPAAAHFCGGSIYNERWIVTAAHCLVNLSAQDVHAVAGTNKLTDGVHRIQAQQLIVHRGYASDSKNNDVALVELRDPIPLGNEAKPIALLQPADEAAVLVVDRTLWVAGWGATEDGHSKVRTLRHVSVPFVARETCNDPLSYNGKVTDNMVCAGVASGGRDSCQGDSGGPLAFTQAPAAPTLVGIVSWGEGCAEPGKYGVYTRVARYSTWIEACVANPGTCQ